MQFDSPTMAVDGAPRAPRPAPAAAHLGARSRALDICGARDSRAHSNFNTLTRLIISTSRMESKLVYVMGFRSRRRSPHGEYERRRRTIS
ncbi:hypothetical protein EVAR_61849_1 [Eumeta japonica]|uniref:Uncharacterized protein n=1 Tax=Eumeta variegata TaxID=151549 RepID=A0A4C1ZX17_EUMVA|nr:hypothetical protein EVAR_61849_1 [Eumeta japonica]